MPAVTSVYKVPDVKSTSCYEMKPTLLICLLTSFNGVEFKSMFFVFFDGLLREARFRLAGAWEK
jgi:predicted exporter